MIDINELHAVVTGAGAGIGRATAIALAGRGASVSCIDIDERAADRTAEEIRATGRIASSHGADVSDSTAVARVLENVRAQHDRIDILINNAATFKVVGPVWEVDAGAWWSEVRTNLLGPFLMCQAVLPEMLRLGRGTIINLSGGGFGGPVPGGTSYCCSKAGVIRLTDALAGELRAVSGDSDNSVDGIRVFALEPPITNTAMNHYMATNPKGREWLPIVYQRLAEGSVEEPSAVGDAICDLIQVGDISLSGRLFPYNTDFSSLPDNEILNSDVYAMRYRLPV